MQHATWQNYLRSLADQLGLRDWVIELQPEPDADESAAASVTVTYGQKHAFVYFGQGFFEYAREEQRYYCVHELLHCQMKGMVDVVRNLAGRLGSDAYDIIHGCHQDALEQAIDGIGRAVARLLPLPPPGTALSPAEQGESLRLVA